MDIALLLKAFIMGVVEGIAEFLPISSTGYLILSADVMHFLSPQKRELFIVFIQLGAILAVMYEYFGRLWRAFVGFITGKSTDCAHPRRLGFALIIATIPVVVFGALFADAITAVLFHPLVVAVMLMLGAGIIWYVEKHPCKILHTHAENIDLKTALYIGLCQCLALLPGTSRSGATIIGAMFFGTSRTAATEFSFFLGIPVIVGAAMLAFIKKQHVLQTTSDWMALLLGTAVSFIVALVCIRVMVAWVSKKDFLIFAYLRIITGILVLIMYVLGYEFMG